MGRSLLEGGGVAMYLDLTSLVLLAISLILNSLRFATESQRGLDEDTLRWSVLSLSCLSEIFGGAAGLYGDMENVWAEHGFCANLWCAGAIARMQREAQRVIEGDHFSSYASYEYEYVTDADDDDDDDSSIAEV